MIRKVQPWRAKLEWHAHFAWLPVRTIDDEWVWREWVERRYHIGCVGCGWQYRLPGSTNEWTVETYGQAANDP